jgi:hypothetical protein
MEVTTDVAGQGTIVVGASGESCTSRCVFPQQSGGVLQLTAVPAPGYAFGSWSGACVGTATICAVAPTSAASVRATFVSSGDLSMTVAGAGVITSSPAGITCGRSAQQCGATYESGQVVTLTAAPAAGAMFDGWGGPCAQYGTDPCQLQVTAATGVTASFRRASPATGPQTLTVTHGSAGILSAPDVLTSCAASDPCSATVPSGTSVTLDAGGPFVGGDGALPSVTWSGVCVGNWPVCRTIVDGPTSITVTQLTLQRASRPAPTAGGQSQTLPTSVSGGGTIRAPSFGLACPHRCEWSLPFGRYVSIIAVPARHHRFVKWVGFCRGTRRTCRLRVDVNEYASAVFRG